MQHFPVEVFVSQDLELAPQDSVRKSLAKELKN